MRFQGVACCVSETSLVNIESVEIRAIGKRDECVNDAGLLLCLFLNSWACTGDTQCN